MFFDLTYRGVPYSLALGTKLLSLTKYACLLTLVVSQRTPNKSENHSCGCIPNN